MFGKCFWNATKNILEIKTYDEINLAWNFVINFKPENKDDVESLVKLDGHIISLCESVNGTKLIDITNAKYDDGTSVCDFNGIPNVVGEAYVAPANISFEDLKFEEE